MENDKIKNILNDLYSADPSLRQEEAKLIPILTELLRARPNVQMDANFKRELRIRLQALRPEPKPRFSFPSFRFAGGLAGVAIAALLVVYGVNMQSPAYNVVQITKSNPGAFGSLSGVTSAPTGASVERGSGIAAPNNVPMGMGSAGAGGMGGGGPMIGGDASIGSKMIVDPFPGTTFKYVYKGEALPALESMVSVYKRQTGTGRNPGGILNGFDLGLFNFSTFSNLKVDNISVSEDKDRGYSINISFPEEVVSIYENWKHWPMMGGQDYRPLQPSEVPADEVLIEMANNFLRAHRISTGAYGTPVVMNQWREMYAAATDKSQIWIPDMATVVYPLQINGQTVYDQGGQPSGLMVNINVRQNRVSGLNELKTNVYSESAYAGETSQERILKLAENGGYNYPIWYLREGEQSEKTVEVELGTPTIELIKVWNYDNSKNTSEELIVPALIFPITKNAPDLWRQNVIVPLAKEILDRQENPGVDGPRPLPVEPMPMDAPAVIPEKK